jgi:hypothetical protein
MNQLIRIRSILQIAIAAVLVAGLGLSSPTAHAQAIVIDFDWQPAPPTPQNWNVDANWRDLVSGVFLVPTAPVDGSYDARARVMNGGTAVVQAPNPPTPSAVLITNGGVTVSSGGVLGTVISVNQLLDGSVYVNRAGTSNATLTVEPGGTLTTAGALLSAGNAANTIVIGGTTAGTATVNVPSASFNGTTRVFPNAAFTSTGSVTWGNASVYQPQINGASAPSLNIGQNAKVAGTLTPTFTGPAPTVGSTWSLMQADDIQGTFFVTSALALPANQRLMTRVVPIAGQRERLDLELSEVLVMTVNRDTGVVRITQPGSTSINLDTYTVASSQARMAPAAWTSLADQGALGGSWQETATSTSSLSEARPSGNGAAAGGANVSLGNIYNPLGGTFAATSTDITFTYSDRDGRIVDGVVNYVGTTVNNLLLQIDPTTGRGRLRNPSNTTVNIDGYAISSAASLTPGTWNSLDDQNTAGGDWLENLAPTTALMAEFKTLGTTTLAPGSAYDLGVIFNPAAARDVTFEFLPGVDGVATFGAVIYEALTDADFDNDNDVDGNDFLRWQRGLGTNVGATNAQGDANGDGAVNAADLAVWRSRFGGAPSVAAAAAVPEPASALLTVVGLALVPAVRRAQRGNHAKHGAAAGK